MADSVALTVRDRMDGKVRVPKATATKPEDEKILKEARARWARCDEAEDSQRKSILAAKKFRAGDQWPAAIKLAREGAQALQGQAAQPPRPCLTIDRLSQPVRQVSNTIKSANFAIDVLPNGHGADDETAQIIKGYLRRVQNQARGESPIEWAADGAIEGGLGWFRLRTDFVHESWDGQVADDALFDQELVIERIANNLSVYCDPSAMKPTRSDAMFAFVTEDMDRDTFTVTWPEADVEGIEDFCATGDMPTWVDKDMVRIAEYWRITYKDEKWARVGGQVMRVEEFPKGLPANDRRVVRRPVVQGFKITATEILERWDWAGSRIPLIPVLGEELNVEGKAVLRGIIQSGMDAQRMVNYTYSGAVEIFALGNKSPYIVQEEQLGDYKAIWETANTYNYAYLPYKYVPNVEPPHRDVSEAPIQAAVALMQVSEEGIKATTGIYDPGLGRQDPQAKSGRAIQALQGQSDLGSSNYPDNVSRAIVYAGELMLEIIPKITRPGQILQILGADDEPEQIMVGVPFQSGPNGQPQPSQGVTPEQAKLSKGLHQFYDLNNGRYAVTVTVGKASTTKREEGMAAVGELLPHVSPEQQAVIIPEYIDAMSFPGAQKIAEMLRKTLPPQLQPQEEGGPDPEKQQLQQMVQQLQEAIKGKQAEKQAEVQAQGQIDLQKTQMQEQSEHERTMAKIQADERQHALDNLVKLAIAEISAQSQQAKVDAEQARTELGFGVDHTQQAHDHAHAAVQAERDRQHEATMAQVAHQQALEQAQQGHQQALEQGEQGQAHALEQGQQAAELAPEPTTETE